MVSFSITTSCYGSNVYSPPKLSSMLLSIFAVAFHNKTSITKEDTKNLMVGCRQVKKDHIANITAAMEKYFDSNTPIDPLEFSKDHNLKEIAQLAGGALSKANQQIAENVQQKMEKMYG